MSLRTTLIEVSTSPKSASIMSAGTVTSGIATFMDLIPSDIGKLASLIGIVLSVVLIYTTIKKGRMEYKKLHLEIEALKIKNESAKAEKIKTSAY